MNAQELALVVEDTLRRVVDGGNPMSFVLIISAPDATTPMCIAGAMTRDVQHMGALVMAAVESTIGEVTIVGSAPIGTDPQLN